MPYIEKEIIHLFDYTIHPSSSERLYQIFSVPRLSFSATLERQQLLQAFLFYWERIQGFTYHKADLQEVYQFTTYVEQPESTIGQYFGKDRYQLQGRCLQTIRLLRNIYGKYLLPLHGIPLLEDFAGPARELYETLEIDKLPKELTFQQTFSFARKLVACRERNLTARFWDSLFEYEAWWSLAMGTIKYGFTIPSFSADNFVIEEFWHPMVTNPVKNNLQTTSNMIVLTGPNMSGKSTTLKAIGLCVSLAHIGLAVPAENCRIPFYDQVLVAINVTDDLKNGFSHFMQEIVHLKNTAIQAKAGQRCFAIFDEIFRGTNIDDAMEVTFTTIKGLSQFRQCHFIISTHLYQLQGLLPPELYEPYQLRAGIQEGVPVNSYRLDRGWSDLKFGRLIFEKEGLSQLLE
ncbi:MutS-related protein [Chitinophaga sp. LS1]|uniref:MutS-related protein n=1 Tax=Chitinophaga sp. LS1 TaxID=3051176 RepID=UPI002AAC33C2|nr:hypothetical protein [Chitinophaga sp. LS1]WPV68586.1 hypothetical protein QQL36_07630 [Chitinophaga sp. LS1]